MYRFLHAFQLNNFFVEIPSAIFIVYVGYLLASRSNKGLQHLAGVEQMVAVATGISMTLVLVALYYNPESTTDIIEGILLLGASIYNFASLANRKNEEDLSKTN